MFQEMSLNFEINKHGLRYEILIDPDVFLGGKSGLPYLKFADER